MLLGAHVSIAGSIADAPQRGGKIGCEAIQIFTKNQRRWRVKKIGAEEAESFEKNLSEFGIESAVAHVSYLVNLGSGKEELYKKSLESFVEEGKRCDTLGIKHLVFHPGTNKGEREGIKNISNALNRAIESTKTIFLLETTAGQGSSIGYKLDQLASIIDRVEDKKRVGICLDTCHMYSAGYDIKRNYEKVVENVEDMIGIERVKVIHLNDSKNLLGSRIDRHEHIGRGSIGIESFRTLVNDKRWANLPGILETPSGEEDYRRNLEILKGLRVEK